MGGVRRKIVKTAMEVLRRGGVYADTVSMTNNRGSRDVRQFRDQTVHEDIKQKGLRAPPCRVPKSKPLVLLQSPL